MRSECVCVCVCVTGPEAGIDSAEEVAWATTGSATSQTVVSNPQQLPPTTPTSAPRTDGAVTNNTESPSITASPFGTPGHLHFEGCNVFGTYKHKTDADGLHIWRSSPANHTSEDAGATDGEPLQQSAWECHACGLAHYNMRLPRCRRCKAPRSDAPTPAIESPRTQPLSTRFGADARFHSIFGVVTKDTSWDLTDRTRFDKIWASLPLVADIHDS